VKNPAQSSRNTTAPRRSSSTSGGSVAFERAELDPLLLRGDDYAPSTDFARA
jgi:hypothetical protein